MDEAKASVDAALELLQEETSRLVEAARQQGAEAYRAGDSGAFERIDRELKELEAFAERVTALAAGWRAIGRGRRRSAPREKAQTRRARPGEALPECEYVGPILQVLHDAGGSAHVRDVKTALGEMLADRLRPADLEAVSGGVIRWANRAQWVRYAMVLGGLLSADSPRNTWEITAEGEAVLRTGDTAGVWPKLEAAKRGRRRP